MKFMRIIQSATKSRRDGRIAKAVLKHAFEVEPELGKSGWPAKSEFH